MQQVFVIHGGDSFATYEEYLERLKNWQLDIERLRGTQDWKGHLAKNLGMGFDVFTPSMPNKRNAKYPEWKIWFDKMVPFMNDGMILIGHSLGGTFLAKYLGEQDIPKRIKATLLVAAPYEEGGSKNHENLAAFIPPQNLEKLVRQGGRIFLYHSTDDSVVSFAELGKYQAALPDAEAVIFEDRGHFNQKAFPELISKLKAL